MKPSQDLSELLSFYEAELLDNVIPWWMEHAIDWENGGILQFIEDDGTVVSQDKYLWSQLRALGGRPTQNAILARSAHPNGQ